MKKEVSTGRRIPRIRPQGEKGDLNRIDKHDGKLGGGGVKTATT